MLERPMPASGAAIERTVASRRGHAKCVLLYTGCVPLPVPPARQTTLRLRSLRRYDRENVARYPRRYKRSQVEQH